MKRQRGKDGEVKKKRKGPTSMKGAKIARTARMASNIFLYFQGRYRGCMQDTFARATHSAYAAARPSARATIGYLVYKYRGCNVYQV